MPSRGLAGMGRQHSSPPPSRTAGRLRGSVVMLLQSPALGVLGLFGQQRARGPGHPVVGRAAVQRADPLHGRALACWLDDLHRSPPFPLRAAGAGGRPAPAASWAPAPAAVGDGGTGAGAIIAATCLRVRPKVAASCTCVTGSAS